MNKQAVLVTLLFFTAGFLVFYPTLSISFVSDDFIWLKESQHPQQFNPFDSQSLAFIKGRPGTMVLFLILHKLFSADAGRFHLVLLVFHILNAFMLFAILRRFWLPFAFCFLTALIFLIHFTNEETLFWASCLSSIFCLFFYLGAVLFYLEDLKKGSLFWKAAILGFILTALAIREDALTIPVTFLLLAYAKNREEVSKKSGLLKRSLIFFLPSIIYLGYRLPAALRESMGYQFTLNPVIWVQNGLYFVFNLVVPMRYIFDQVGYEVHERLLRSISALMNLRWLAGIGVLALVAAFTMAFRLRSRVSGLIKIGACLGAIGLLPYVALVGNAPRFHYFALTGGALVLALAIFGVSKRISRTHPGRAPVLFGAILVVSNFVILRERGGWWIKSSRMAFEIVEQTKTYAGSLAPGDTMYVANLPHRLHGAHVFHQGGYAAWSPFEEAVALHAPELAGRVRYLGDKNSNELKEFEGKMVYVFEGGKLRRITEF